MPAMQELPHQLLEPMNALHPNLEETTPPVADREEEPAPLCDVGADGSDPPPKVHVGSYREEDMIDALRLLCPTLGTDKAEPKVVMLDWFAAHRSPEVIAFLKSEGYVVLFLGGGCTPAMQIKDTDLHAESHPINGRKTAVSELEMLLFDN